VLLTAALGWRKANFSVFGMGVKGVDVQARDLAIREESRGEVDLLGAAVRLATIGSRGAATCALWVDALDAQKKNQWNELEMYVRSLTKLQPHFITPWIFQSWNLSYNVSVEADRINDKYFYIARGVGLLAEGERQNHNNPDMRWSIGFFMQHKIGQSDQTNTLRSLFQLSTIPPNERDPGRFWTREGRQEVNFTELEDFCKKHPQLARRLREGIRREHKREVERQFKCESAKDVVDFLADNFRVPSLWQDRLPSSPGLWKEDADKLLAPTDRFPVLPPEHRAQPHQQPPDGDVLTDQSSFQLLDEQDVHQVARAWYAFAQEPLPAPDDLPGHNKPIENRVYQRLPKHMMTLIFRDYPAQAQRFTAERLQEEGWYDDAGWTIPGWFREDRFREGPALVGRGHKWSLQAWQKAFDLWKKFGEANHLLLSNTEEETKLQRSKSFAEKYNLEDTSAMPQLREENLDAETAREYFDWQFMKWYKSYRTTSNFPHHYNRALVESKEETVLARKTFFDADALRLGKANGDRLALRKYQEPNSLKAWRDKVLLTNKAFRRDPFIQEQTFEIQLNYIDLYRRQGGVAFKAQSAGLVLMPMQVPFGGGACPTGLTSLLASHRIWPGGKSWEVDLDKSRRVDLDKDNPLLGGPFDGTDDEGVPLIESHARDTVMRRKYPAAFAAPAAESTPPGQNPAASPKRK
jgi:hypothetical protein